jgi:acetyl-CoA synthetase
MNTASEQFRAARDFLLAHRTDYETAYAKFRWPRPSEFNFAVDWFDAVLTAEHPDRAALRLIEEDGRDASYTGRRTVDMSHITIQTV